MYYNLEWKKYNGSNIEDPGTYITDWVNANPHGEIIIGCDSQSHTKHIKYSVSICMHMKDEYGIGHGAHVIFANHFDADRALRKDITAKLALEAVISAEVAEMANEALGGPEKITVHLDYNTDPKYFSHSLIGNVGSFKGMGYQAFGKPNAWAASHTSDALCKNKQAKGVR